MGVHHEHGPGSWSELPADVLVTVLEGVAVRDLCRAGAVCRWWRAAVSYVRGQHRALSRPRTPPCLLYMAAGSTTSSDDPFAATLYSITDGRSYPVPLNGASIPGDELWLGASHGWLVTVDDHAELHLVNPVTGERIDSLPSVATIEQVRRVHDDSGAIVADRYLVYPYDWSLKVLPQELDHPMWLDSHQLIKYLYIRALMSSDPSGGGDCVVVLIHWPHYQLSFARPGDAHWTWISPPQGNTECCDCGFDNDSRILYALHYNGAIHAFDLHGCPALEREVVLHPQVHQVTTRITKYLVHAPWLGCWLQVWRNMELIDPTRDDEATEWMRVYQAWILRRRS
ncbi:hypothetical protein U9M48_026724 [Paspalum notatum var. saurae]|uniref:F-box domain-containing protein n=1 Tax=Paspalum notatum var. saurae TaxID=547442 RepID=A0AAQ3WZG4_PASNO